MGVQLVTGKTGMPVSSKQDGALYAAIVGKDKYVTSIGSKCSASMQDANTLVVQDGYCLTNGRVVEYKGTTNFTIPSGTQGQKRAHLCGHRVTIDEEGNEKSEAIVLSGEPTSDGEPVDPTYNDGSLLDGATTVDHMLYRVVTDGINALDPVALFTPISTADEFRDSISQFEAKVLWSNPAGQYMQASQTINLNEKISEQRTGIVLHWQGYEENEAKNYDHNYCFIPKTHTSRSGVAMFLTNQSGTHIGTKYVYVSNTKIEGHDNNYSNATASGITLDRRYFVLTEVLGV